MQIKLFTVSIADGGVQSEELNTFLRANKILEVENHLVHNERGAYWCFCVKYLLGEHTGNNRNLQYKEKVDYRNVLDENTFKHFSKLREIRKQLANEEAVPAFAVFTDEELANIAQLSPLTSKTMLTVKGIGEKKVEKYGQRLINLLQQDKPTT